METIPNVPSLTPTENPSVTVDPNSQTSVSPVQSSGKKFPWFFLILIGFFVLSAGISLFLLKNAPSKSSTTSQAMQAPQKLKTKVLYLTGSAWKTVSARRTEILEGDTLSEKDELVTDKNTRMTLSFDDGSVVRVGSETKLTLSQLLARSMVLTQSEGIVFSRVQKDPNHEFIIQAGFSTIKALGTVFSVEKGDDVNVKVFENKVEITKDNDPSYTQEIGENQKWQETKGKVEPLQQKEITDNTFLAWSLAEDTKEQAGTPVPTNKPTEKPSSTPKLTSKPTSGGSAGTITLSGKNTDEGVKLEWSVESVDVSGGFKIVKNTSGNPTYPENASNFAGSEARSAIIKLTDGQTWHFRVCQFISSGKCGTYSNEVTIKVPGEKVENKETTSKVSSITLTLEKNNENKVVARWTVAGTSALGYKVIWSKVTQPSYPTRDGDTFHYLSDPNARDDTVGDLIAGETYYFRVCEYLGGSCGTYSNEASIRI